MTRVLLLVGALVGAVVAVVALRSTSMTVHTEMPANSHLVVEANARWRGDHTGPARLARALTLQCSAETSDGSVVRDFAWRGGPFSFELTPGLDEPDQRQLKGCLSDLRMPKLIVSVDRMQSVVPAARG